MDAPRYTAKLRFENAITLSQNSDDYQALLHNLLNQLEGEGGMVSGEIIDNLCGVVIHSCQKSGMLIS